MTASDSRGGRHERLASAAKEISQRCALVLCPPPPSPPGQKRRSIVDRHLENGSWTGVVCGDYYSWTVPVKAKMTDPSVMGGSGQACLVSLGLRWLRVGLLGLTWSGSSMKWPWRILPGAGAPLPPPPSFLHDAIVLKMAPISPRIIQAFPPAQMRHGRETTRRYFSSSTLR